MSIQRNTVEFIINEIDQMISRQLNVVLHHSLFQRLEASWRGLFMVVLQKGMTKSIKIKLLSCSEKELSKDCLTSLEFDQSQLFKKIYSQEFDHPGGEPFGLLIGDYYFTHHRHAGIRGGMNVLQHVSKTAAAAYCPFIASVEPSFFGLNSLREMQPNLRLAKYFQHEEYRPWQELRETEDARFLGLTLPRIMLRQPYNHRGTRLKHRYFVEDITSCENYLWGNASFAYACVTIKAFKETGWFSDIRGIDPERLTGGIVESLVRDDFKLSPTFNHATSATEVNLTDGQEKILSDMGFLALRDLPSQNMGIFYSSQSIQRYSRFRNSSATTNAKISSMLHYMLCVSRFAHYIKIMLRDKIGSFVNISELEDYLRRWLLSYCSANVHASEDEKIRSPLSDAQVTLFEQLDREDKLLCNLHIKPHYQLDQVQSQLRLVSNKLNV